MKKFIEEFKAFILRGNVMDMAVGVIIGSAFASLVTALTNDFINPLINSIGGAEFGGKLHLPWTPDGANGQFILWGDFLTAVINFVIMAFVLFLMLKIVNKLMTVGKTKLTKKEKEEKEDAKPGPTEIELLESILKELKKKK